jgi:prepilin peptidase CpaA
MTLANITHGNSSLILMIFLAAAVANDIYSRRIPNSLVAITLVSGIALHAAYLGGDGLVTALTGSVVGLLIFIPFYAIGGLGAGDVKLLAAVGAFLGPWAIGLAGLTTLVVGGILGLSVLLWQRIGVVLAARFLSIPPAVLSDSKSESIPYSIAIAAGVLITIFNYETAMSLMFSA